MNASLDAIVTRNPKDFAGSPIPILTRVDVLAVLSKAREVWSGANRSLTRNDVRGNGCQAEMVSVQISPRKQN